MGGGGGAGVQDIKKNFFAGSLFLLPRIGSCRLSSLDTTNSVIVILSRHIT